MNQNRWDTYRLGAKLPSLDGLISSAAESQIEQLHRALSSVACRQYWPLPTDINASSNDARFIGRLLLGLLARGWPTHSSHAVEASLIESIDPRSELPALAQEETSFEWKLQDSYQPSAFYDELVLSALIRADARLQADEAEIALLAGSVAELDFYHNTLAPLLGGAIGWVEFQRPISSMLNEDVSDLNKLGSSRVDFALEIPGRNQPIRIVIELDGPHHASREQRQIDNDRDRLLDRNDWNTWRIALTQWEAGDTQHLPAKVNAVVTGNAFPFSYINGDDGWMASHLHREITRLVLTPQAIARIQFGLTKALMEGSLSLNDAHWVIAVTEREVPCAELALRDWLQTLKQLCQLYDVPLQINHVVLLVAEDHLTSFNSPVWNCNESDTPEVVVDQLTRQVDTLTIDVAIDVSVSAHPTRRYPTDPLESQNLLVRHRLDLRTAQRQSGYCLEPWSAPRVIASPMQQRTSLQYFLGYLFRKKSFRKGQLEIIERVLRRQDVIGLLPTGAGKSITFQLPALLTPGLTLILDPLKSLMHDQVDNLRRSGITDSIQINSDTTSKERRVIEWKFSTGEYRLIFISPERLQIQDFRDRLRTTAHMRPIAYFVVDEAHCVSEWGHDFRTAYLNIGRIAQNHCSQMGKRPPIIALTGTASESVLRDVQRELDVIDDGAIVRPQDFDRKELKFEIVPVLRTGKLSALCALLNSEIPSKLQLRSEQLASGECGGLVFCPWVNNELGVFDVANAIPRQLPQFAHRAPGAPSETRVGFYSGEKPKALEMSSTMWSGHKLQLQRSFKDGRTPLLVATKAFGMGIDKPNIRYTVHFAMAQSVEAFAQEAGRAGRDHQDAICAVLFTDRHATTQRGPTPLDCLELGIPVEEANRRAQAAGRNSDDAELQMFLHARSYPGMVRESQNVRHFFHTWIEPSLPVELPNSMTLAVISESELQSSFRPDPLSCTEPNEGAPTNSDSITDIQRMLYRLSLLGLVEDYTVRYQPGSDIYSISIRSLSADAVREQLFAYVNRYLTADRLRDVEKYLDASSISDEIDKYIDALCWFIYEEIEQRRRQNIHNMRQLLRDSLDGADLSRRINAFLSTTALTQVIFDALAADDYREWANIASQITSVESAERVYYQCLRALEDAPGHPGLILLNALALLNADLSRQLEVVANLKFGFSRARLVLASDYRAIADWISTEVMKSAPVTGSQILCDLLFESQDPILAKAVLALAASGVFAPSRHLVDAANRCLLQKIDARLEAFVLG